MSKSPPPLIKQTDMYSIRRIKITDDAKIERTEPAVSYDKVVYEDKTKLMYRKPDGNIRRFWVGCSGENLESVGQVFVMNQQGKTIERI